jgi:dimethylamine/trimethylamine dehydrogenase
MPGSRFDVLFEPVAIGPVTARNRFFQVPHCNGMGHRDPTAHAVMRGVKAEGGWAVVCTEEVEIHYSTDVSPYIEGRIWDDADIPAHARLAAEVHKHGALAGIELVHSGFMGANLYVRQPPLGPAHLPVPGTHPVQARKMSAGDISDLRRWHRQAVARSLRAGYDLVYVYAGHGLTTIQHFLSRRYNDREDAYGGSIENRARLLREILEDTLDEVDGAAAVACRICVDELIGGGGLERDETQEVLGLVGELPDLWDFMVGDWDFDSITSRFADEGAQEAYVRGLKQLTSKPVVGVGRFTSPDTMVRMIEEGVLDLIGAARPSIADPFLPRKIEEGRFDEIRECIGCNICVTCDTTATPVRCTQNPTMGEEWRRGWHPERIREKTTDAKVLVVGAGPAGLEAAQALGKRGYEVVLAEAGDALGGRVALEARLPGLAPWIRVLDYRKGQLDRLANVEIAFGSRLDAQEILSYDFDHVALATGSRWRADGVGRWNTQPLDLEGVEILTPDHLMSGSRPAGTKVVLYDDDHYYMGGVLAELLATESYEVTLVTPEPRVSEWTVNTMEQHRIQRRLLELDIAVLTSRTLVSASGGAVRTACVYTEREQELECDALVVVSSRLPEDGVATELEDAVASGGGGGPVVRLVGDAWSPGTIAAAVWDGHRYAQELDEPVSPGDEPPFLREVIELAPLGGGAR